ncbi:MAG: RsmD family RNA methyltransferase [Planctomycetia bacterium]|nr:RsmD family RNA methyltransferase [Planctomycetia bacterium]
MKGSRGGQVDPVGLRIIGGMHRGRRLRYGGDQRVRPMKDRVREAVFNLLGSVAVEVAGETADQAGLTESSGLDNEVRGVGKIGSDGEVIGEVGRTVGKVGVDGAYVVDLFAGTGAMGLESLSRGAAFALFLERHLPTLKIIRENICELNETKRTKIVFGDTFMESRWLGELPRERRWCVFCCPPYELFRSRTTDLCAMLRTLRAMAPVGSLFVVESDDQFDTNQLPESDRWRIRRYPPAVVAVAVKTVLEGPGPVSDGETSGDEGIAGSSGISEFPDSGTSEQNGVHV